MPSLHHGAFSAIHMTCTVAVVDAAKRNRIVKPVDVTPFRRIVAPLTAPAPENTAAVTAGAVENRPAGKFTDAVESDAAENDTVAVPDAISGTVGIVGTRAVQLLSYF